MAHLYETTLIETTDGLQCKVYANDHPNTAVIVRPRYIPQEKVPSHGLATRFLFGRRMTRFNPFAQKKYLAPYLRDFKKKYPRYFYMSPVHNRRFFAVPKNKIAKIYDSRVGLGDLLNIRPKELDSYLALVRGLVLFLAKSGVPPSSFGITNSTLLGNYTFGKSDIDIVIFGKKNGWKIFNYLTRAKHPLMQWKSGKEWRTYFKTHDTPGLSENDFVFHSMRKRHEGLFGKHVFTLFPVEEPNEIWSKWGDEKYSAIGTATIEAKVIDDRNSLVRPAMYEISGARIVRTNAKKILQMPIKQIVTYAMPFMLQAKTGETVEAAGLLEKAVPKKGLPYLRLVVEYPHVWPPSKKRSDEYIRVIK